MSLSDLGLSFRHLLEFIQYPATEGSAACILSAWLGTFFILATSSWYFLISVVTFRTFLGRSTANGDYQPTGYSSKQVSLWEHGFVWGLSLFAALFPGLSGYFGVTEDDGTCWITKDHRLVRLIVTIPLCIYLTFAATLLWFVNSVSHRLMGMSDARSRVMRQMVFFVGVFFLTWSWTLMDNIYGIANQTESRPIWIRYLDSIAVSGSGFFNFLVWSSSGSVHRALCGPRIHKKICPWMHFYLCCLPNRSHIGQHNNDTEKDSEAQVYETATYASESTCLSTEAQIQDGAPLSTKTENSPFLTSGHDDDSYFL